ncbi:MAG: DUF188 domain-containing protein [Spirochaetota bacterium]|nr:DUF188 domain-containing protein [Spirochaetota bacterium]
MHIWIDADSFPRRLRSIVRKAALRTKVRAVFVSDRKLMDVKGSFVENIVVPHGSGRADEEMVERVEPGDLAITRDIPLAARLVDRGAIVIDDRGKLYTTENIRERLSIRHAMEGFRMAGINLEGSNPPGEKEVRLFAGALDRELTKLLN